MLGFSFHRKLLNYFINPLSKQVGYLEIKKGIRTSNFFIALIHILFMFGVIHKRKEKDIIQKQRSSLKR